MTTVQESLGTSQFDQVTRRRRPTTPLHHWVEPGVLHVVGEVDQWSVGRFGDALRACEADPCVQALDLSEVTFFSAAGVTCFVERAWTVRPHAAIIASQPVRRVLTLCDMEFLLGRHGWREAYDGWRVRRYPSF